jgi:hypothetical protein
MSRTIKTKASKGQFRPQGDKVRGMVTKRETKGDLIFFRDSVKKSFDKQSPPATFHFIGSNNASDKNQTKPHRK